MRGLLGKGTSLGLAATLPATISTVCASIRLRSVSATLKRKFGHQMVQVKTAQNNFVVA
jgi:hypothetical protein